MHGVSLLPNDDGSQASETLRIAVGGDAEIAYYARMGAMREIGFPLARSGENEVVFENPDNEPLKRVVYRREGEALVSALYESIEPGSIGWETRYIPCASE